MSVRFLNYRVQSQTSVMYMLAVRSLMVIQYVYATVDTKEMV